MKPSVGVCLQEHLQLLFSQVSFDSPSVDSSSEGRKVSLSGSSRMFHLYVIVRVDFSCSLRSCAVIPVLCVRVHVQQKLSHCLFFVIIYIICFRAVDFGFLSVTDVVVCLW